MDMDTCIYRDYKCYICVSYIDALIKSGRRTRAHSRIVSTPHANTRGKSVTKQHTRRYLYRRNLRRYININRNTRMNRNI